MLLLYKTGVSSAGLYGSCKTGSTEGGAGPTANTCLDQELQTHTERLCTLQTEMEWEPCRTGVLQEEQE